MATWTMKLMTFLAPLAAATVVADGILPDASRPWTSIRPGVDYQVAVHHDDHQWYSMAHERMLREGTTSSSSLTGSDYHDQFIANFADSSFYDEYSTAWRLLGFYIDCTVGTNVEARVGSNSNNNNNNNVATCQRHLLWAAYVDVNYEGGGTGEYMYWNTETNSWNDAACRVRNPYYDKDSYGGTLSQRCAKMDCHLSSSTTFQLLGFYREAQFGDFFEQLFKHQGYCLWEDDDKSQFMYQYSMYFPEACTQSQYSATDANGNSVTLYYDVKPLHGGRFDMGLYTNEVCTEEYSGSDVSMDDIFGNDNQYGLTWDEFITQFNNGLDTFRVCQPCKTALLSDQSAAVDDDGNVDNDDAVGRRRRLRELQDNDDDPNGGYFQCQDMANMKDINQCMKFAAKTNMEVARFRDVQMASAQGTIQPTHISGVKQSQLSVVKQKYGFFIFSIVFFVCCVLLFLFTSAMARRSRQRRAFGTNLKEPLVKRSGKT
jgi:hypothetical protein